MSHKLTTRELVMSGYLDTILNMATWTGYIDDRGQLHAVLRRPGEPEVDVEFRDLYALGHGDLAEKAMVNMTFDKVTDLLAQVGEKETSLLGLLAMDTPAKKKDRAAVRASISAHAQALSESIGELRAAVRDLEGTHTRILSSHGWYQRQCDFQGRRAARLERRLEAVESILRGAHNNPLAMGLLVLLRDDPEPVPPAAEDGFTDDMQGSDPDLKKQAGPFIAKMGLEVRRAEDVGRPPAPAARIYRTRRRAMTRRPQAAGDPVTDSPAAAKPGDS